MFSQFFGNFLLSKGVVTTEQLLHAIKEQHSRHLKVGTLAIHSGYMTASEVDTIVIRQTHEDKRFGEIAIEEGYLTEEQLMALLQAQTPDYLLIGQILVDEGVLNNTQLEELIAAYQRENQLSELEGEQKDNLDYLVRNLMLLSTSELPEYLIKYLTLLFNNLVRFVGEDFTPLNPTLYSEYVTDHCSAQTIDGDFQIVSYIDVTEETAIAFASRYVGEDFTEFDEYVQASSEDFLNLHNGLFNVNVSNEDSVELHLNAPVSMANTMISSTEKLVHLPILYPFGILNFLFKV
ncbi:MAG: chemotaxis protein CheX [Lachnospiraceae bacterium]|nr:chemotaxis protein CheX [Lachnospiraceae bacterium]